MTTTAYAPNVAVCPLMAFVKENTPPRVDIQKFDDSFADEVFSSTFSTQSETETVRIPLNARLAAARRKPSLHKALPPNPPSPQHDHSPSQKRISEYDPFAYDYPREAILYSSVPAEVTKDEIHYIAAAPKEEIHHIAAEPREETHHMVEEQKEPTQVVVEDAVQFPETSPEPIEEASHHIIIPMPSMDSLPALSTSISTAPSTTGSASETSQDNFAQSTESQPPLPDVTSMAIPRKRGFMRPQTTSFATSARNRDSVMDLGSISHLQYYFARTGLLDGRGGQLARNRKGKTDMTLDLSNISENTSRSVSMGSSDAQTPDGLLSVTSPGYAISENDLVQSPAGNDDGSYCIWSHEGEVQEMPLLPPTVSTCKKRAPVIAPPPDITKLRRVLTEALEDALKVLTEAENCTDDTPGFHELRGLHLLDIITLAIRAAKAYYTSHPRPSMLYAQKPDRQLRTELFDVLEMLQRMGARKFAGGIRSNEKVGLLAWIVGISELIQGEIEAEKTEQQKRQEWIWRGSNEAWVGREREREWSFMNSFADEADQLPRWTEIASAPPTDSLVAPYTIPPLLQHLSTGLTLVRLHNKLVALSSRPFEAITTFHTDTAKPYRCAENLRYWLKAAERRWEVKLNLDVTALMRIRQTTDSSISNEADITVWKQFDDAMLKWCGAIRGELEKEWDEAAAVEESNVRKRMAEGEALAESST